LWGISFKPETDDIRQAPAIFLIEKLLKMGAHIRAFDPVAMENARAIFKDKVTFCEGNYQCLEGADALVIVTEWNEFRSPNFAKIKQLLKTPVLFDGRNLYSPEKLKELGFDYFSIGR
ncbi:MAG: UDP-glucose/GDP-mannose dehydrogenase family protein, partial [Deltaproteobacteria bacterium]|nr:UDP-glucose/GDP-mannose dehydrogenase family protein [Deltaproteobacteria bacterium]